MTVGPWLLQSLGRRREKGRMKDEGGGRSKEKGGRTKKEKRRSKEV